MHISEGILPPSWAGLWFLVAAPFWFWGLHTIRSPPGRRSLVRDPGGPGRLGDLRHLLHARALPAIGTCSHPCGTGLGAILIGPGPTVVVASIALLLQALFLAHGGLTTLGANIVSMGVVGAFSGYCLFHGLRRLGCRCSPPRFSPACSRIGPPTPRRHWNWRPERTATRSITAMFLVYAAAFVPTQLPLGIAEGVVTAVAYRFVWLRRPELLGLLPQAAARRRRKTMKRLHAILIIAVLGATAVVQQCGGTVGTLLPPTSSSRTCPPVRLAAAAAESATGKASTISSRKLPRRPAIPPASLISISIQGDLGLFVFLWPARWAASSPDIPSASYFRRVTSDSPIFVDKIGTVPAGATRPCTESLNYFPSAARPRRSRLARLDVRVKLIVAVAAILAVAFSTRVALPLATLAVCWACWRPSGAAAGDDLPPDRPAGHRGRRLPLAGVDRPARLRWPRCRWGPGGWSVSREGLLDGALIAARGLRRGGRHRGARAPSPRPIEIFAGLRWARLPRTWIEIAMLMVRSIFTLLEQAASVLSAQKTRLGHASYRRRLQSLGSLAGIVHAALHRPGRADPRGHGRPRLPGLAAAPQLAAAGEKRTESIAVAGRGG